MTPEEAAIERIEALQKLGKLSDTVDTIVAIEIAIEALKEIQQYRKIGTVEECREMASIISKVERNELAKIIDEWLLYKKIGTVEECREAVESQKPKKPKKPKEILRHRGGFEMQHCPKCDTDYQVDRRYKIKDGYCPACGKLLDSAFRNYCANCGQDIDENLEGMEDD